MVIRPHASGLQPSLPRCVQQPMALPWAVMWPGFQPSRYPSELCTHSSCGRQARSDTRCWSKVLVPQVVEDPVGSAGGEDGVCVFHDSLGVGPARNYRDPLAIMCPERATVEAGERVGNAPQLGIVQPLVCLFRALARNDRSWLHLSRPPYIALLSGQF